MPNDTHDLERLLGERSLILLSNREPYEHVAAADGPPQVRRPPGGLVSALDPTMRRTCGTWVAWGSGSADRESADADGRLQVPPEEPAYTLRRVWLDDADVEGYYLGFANSALWPLCHMLVQHYHFRTDAWDRYRAVNARFADAVADEARRAARPALVWVQDYHFALVAAMLRERFATDGAPMAGAPLVHQFWHIPFPPPDIFRLLPTSVCTKVLRGLLGNDLLEFHTERYATNFLDCVAEFLPDVPVRREDRRALLPDGRVVHVGAFPISIDVDHYEALARDPAQERRCRELRESHARGDCQLAVSVDRVDYTKGIPERLRALDQLWDTHPELRQKVTVLLVATPSRSELQSYQEIETEIRTAVDAINGRYGTEHWTPIVLVNENVDAAGLAAIYRAGDLCLVSSLQDGMNLVAKEFVACNVDERGVLVLSRFTGAAEEIDDAVLINPFNVDGFVDGLREALTMPAEERRARMRRMRTQLHAATIFDWLAAILTRVREVGAGDAVRAPASMRLADVPRPIAAADERSSVPAVDAADALRPADLPPTGIPRPKGPFST